MWAVGGGAEETPSLCSLLASWLVPRTCCISLNEMS
jgi:hypothetical protein